MPAENELYDLSDFFKILGDSTRMKIIWALDESEMCVCDLAALLNMTMSAMKKAVDWISGRALLEASGNVNLQRVAGIAATGVDMISVGELTHSVRAVDISLKVRGDRL